MPPKKCLPRIIIYLYLIVSFGDAPALGLLADLDEAPVHAVLPHQFRMRSALGDAAVVHHQDLIGILNGGWPAGARW